MMHALVVIEVCLSGYRKFHGIIFKKFHNNLLEVFRVVLKALLDLVIATYPIRILPRCQDGIVRLVLG